VALKLGEGFWSRGFEKLLGNEKTTTMRGKARVRFRILRPPAGNGKQGGVRAKGMPS